MQSSSTTHTAGSPLMNSPMPGHQRRPSFTNDDGFTVSDQTQSPPPPQHSSKLQQSTQLYVDEYNTDHSNPLYYAYNKSIELTSVSNSTLLCRRIYERNHMLSHINTAAYVM